MNSRPFMPRSFKPLLPFVLLTSTTSFLTAGAQAQAPPVGPAGPIQPTLTYTQTGSGTTTLLGQATDYRNYTFSITGFSNVASDPTNFYTIFSISNSTIESSPNFYGLAPFNLPTGWSFTDTSDFIISTDAIGIHATDPTFGLTVFQKAGTPAINPNGAPVELYHQVNGVNPFTNPNGSPLMIPAQAVPEASSLVSLGLLLVGGGIWQVRRSRRQSI